MVLISQLLFLLLVMYVLVKIYKTKYGKLIILIVVGSAVLLYWTYCTVNHTKTGEALILEDKGMTLKVITRYDRYPLHYNGPSFTNVCKSSQTGSAAARPKEFVEAGWNVIAAPDTDTYLVDYSGDLLAEKFKKAYFITDDMTLIFNYFVAVNVTFDGCRSFANWELTNDLPKEFLVDSTPEYEACVKYQADQKSQGLTVYGDCFLDKLKGENKMSYSELTAKKNGTASFVIHSNAFKEKKSYRIQTTDFGKTWKIE